MAEGEVPAVGAGDVQFLRAGGVRRVTVGGRQPHQHGAALGDGDSAQFHVLGGKARCGAFHRPVVAQQFLDRTGQQVRFVAQQPQLVGVGEQGQHPVADEVDGGLMARDEQQLHHAEQFPLGQLVALVGGHHQRADQIGLVVGVNGVVHPRAGLRDQRGQVLLADPSGPLALGGAFLGQRRGEHHPGPLAEVVAVLEPDAEQLADHRDRQREGQRRDQVDLALPGHAIE
ncbi:hypothetical protein GCM10011581_27830 [Saccharopolyspora subtropica]|uniref:Uncharacterized protein n=1 Tax=Saccharopolyspora thermophila TaxID=89367 RepID=A0A917JWY5_9PSEU|nr:hypothetical protein GCM10011581_27830 [Saccharopolyspora subtropica]